MSDATVLIPARYASSRLPGKPLLQAAGKPLIQHVVEAASRAKCADRVVVATDDQRIVDVVEGFGAKAVMTSEDCRSGTDRLAEAAQELQLDDDAIVINVQGDEPDIPGEIIDQLVHVMESAETKMATAATPLSSDRADDPSKVKVVLDAEGKAMYFSRAKIPVNRDRDVEVRYLWHLGLYAYRVSFLKQYAAMNATPAEQAEKLEQLRVLENGYDIAVAIVDYHGIGIDTPEDYEAFKARFGE